MIRLSDYEKFAAETLNPNQLNFYRSGSEEEVTLRSNIEALKRYKVIPRVLRDVSNSDPSTTVLGHRIPFPVCISPTAQHGRGHAVGEVGTAQGAAAAGTIFTLSSFATRSITEVSRGSPTGCKFQNVYIFRDRQVTRRIMREAEEQGFKALVVTVDSPSAGPVLGPRVELYRKHFERMPVRQGVLFPAPSENSDHFMYGLSQFDPSVTWKDITWLKSHTALPIILKGILSSEDAVKAVELGVAGILVSNHGGRQLDTTPATIDVLGEIVRAVDGRCEVYMDGGIRTGTDVLKALALGARAVFIGRPAIYALVHNGAKGVEEMLQILKAEFEAAMNMAGCAKISDIKPTLIRHDSQYVSRI